MGIQLIFKNKERLPYGSNSRGKMIASESGRRAIFVPSFGALEKEEVEYLVEAAKEQEDDRLRKGKISVQKAALEAVTNEVRKAKPGQRAKTARILGGQK